MVISCDSSDKLEAIALLCDSIDLSEAIAPEEAINLIQITVSPYRQQWQDIVFSEAIDCLEFAAQRKKRNCTPGKSFACGGSCQPLRTRSGKLTNCKTGLNPEAKQAQEWLKSNGGASGAGVDEPTSTSTEQQSGGSAEQAQPSSSQADTESADEPTFTGEQYNPYAKPDMEAQEFVDYFADKVRIQSQDDSSQVWNQSFDEWKETTDSAKKTKNQFNSEVSNAVFGGQAISDKTLADAKLTKRQIAQAEQNKREIDQKRPRVAEMERRINHPLMTDEEIAGYKPKMTKEEAISYTGNSYFSGVDFYNGNASWITQSVQNEGAKPELNNKGIYGQGFYMGALKSIGESYASGALTEISSVEVMSGRVKLKNPYIATAEEMNILGENFPGGQSNGVSSWALTAFLRAKGHDGVYVKDLGYISAFDGRQVVIYESETTKAGSARARRYEQAMEKHASIADSPRHIRTDAQYGNQLLELSSSENRDYRDAADISDINFDLDFDLEN